MTFLGLPIIPVLLVLFIIGACLGRFLNLCIDQFWRHEKLQDQLKSVCPGTSLYQSHAARFWRFENVPILGGLIPDSLRKKPKREALVEFLNGFLFAALYWAMIPAGTEADLGQSGLYSKIWAFSAGADWAELKDSVTWIHFRYLYFLVMVEALIVATFIDFDHQIIPDGATVPVMIFGLLGAFLLGRGYLVPVWFQNSGSLETYQIIFPEWFHPLLQGKSVPDWIRNSSHLAGLATSLVGWLVGGGIVWGVRLIGFWVLKREAMGFGDVILMAMIGSFIGWQPVVIAFFIAPICGCAVAIFQRIVRGEVMIAYGPYLSLGAIVVLLCWQPIWSFFGSYFELGALVPLIGLIMAFMMLFLLQLIQLVKQLFGANLYFEVTEGEWTAADQLQFFEGEKVDLKEGLWKEPDAANWSGVQAGRGQLFEQQWRKGHHWK